MVEKLLSKVSDMTDGESVDVLEHFFWGKRHGLAMELGALDGSDATHSMTVAYERSLNWVRILIDGNPEYRKTMVKKNPLAFDVHAAICTESSTVHYNSKQYVGGRSCIIIVLIIALLYSSNINDITNSYLSA